MVYTGIIFEGGGVKGIAHVGAVEELVKKGLPLSTMKYFGGTSAGALVALLFACGYSVIEVNDIIFSINWKKFKDGSKFGFFANLVNLWSKYGLYNGKYIEYLVDKVIFNKFNKKNVTFIQHFNLSGNHLKVVGTNISKKQTEYFDYVNSPNMPISIAIRISMNVPYFYEAVKYNNDYYVDGGLLRNLDLNLFPTIDILALDLVEDDKDCNTCNKMTLVSFTMSLLETLYQEANVVMKPDNVDIIYILNTKIDAFKFNLSERDKQHLKNTGRTAALKFDLI
jgi:NTE family protein